MKKTRVAGKIFAGFWGAFLGLRIIFLVARTVGVIGAFETLAEWTGHPDAIHEFEAWADSLLMVIISYME
jgi:hypothetical protein